MLGVVLRRLYTLAQELEQLFLRRRADLPDQWDAWRDVGTDRDFFDLVDHDRRTAVLGRDWFGVRPALGQFVADFVEVAPGAVFHVPVATQVDHRAEDDFIGGFLQQFEGLSTLVFG